MQISPGDSNTCLFAPAPYYKLNKGFFLGFLFKPLGGLRPPRGLNKKASEKYPLSITYIILKLNVCWIICTMLSSCKPVQLFVNMRIARYCKRKVSLYFVYSNYR